MQKAFGEKNRSWIHRFVWAAVVPYRWAKSLLNSLASSLHPTHDASNVTHLKPPSPFICGSVNVYITSLLSFPGLTGIVLICFSLVGMRAACTGNPKLAKLFMMIYPFWLVYITVITIMRTVMAPSTFTQVVILVLFVRVFFCAYYFKVKSHIFVSPKQLMSCYFCSNVALINLAAPVM